MTPLRNMFDSDPVRRLLCRLGAGYIRLVWWTGRWTVVRGDVPQAFWDKGEPFILSFWHGRILMMPRCWNPAVPIHMLISSHADGRLIADTVGHFGIHTIAGSTTHGGAGALRALLKALKAGASVGITPDGPRGPRMRASDGVVIVARMSGASIVPATFGISRRRVLATWDRFVVAWPFARGVLVWGEPVRVAADADADALEAARGQVEDTLNAITAEADALCGTDAIPPAPVAAEAAS